MTELEALKAKLAARENVSGWQKTCEAIKKRIEELENGR
jgi:hypothetical protein